MHDVNNLQTIIIKKCRKVEKHLKSLEKKSVREEVGKQPQMRVS